MLPAPRQKLPEISPIFKADTVTLHVSREKDREIAAATCSRSRKIVGRPAPSAFRKGASSSRTDCGKEFPASWFAHARLSPSGRDCSLNYFGVDASQPLSVWRDKGWIHPNDPRGWFQWYCRYYMGRRMPQEDARQIKRWKAIRRHVAQIKKHCEPGDQMCRPRQRQALLHWAYDSRTI